MPVRTNIKPGGSTVAALPPPPSVIPKPHARAFATPPTGPRAPSRTYAQVSNSPASRGGNNLRQQATNRYAGSRVPNQSIPAGLLQSMAGMNIGGAPPAPLHATRQARVHVPSIAPPPSNQSVVIAPPPSVWVPSTAANLPVTLQNQHPRHGWFKNEICTTSPYHRGTFQVGDVIGAPYHKANMSKQAQPGHEVVISAVGPVFSKRRMFIVLWMTEEEMFCLPLYSWQNTGIQKKRKYIQDYVCVGNFNKKDKFRHSGVHEPVWFVHKYPDGELTDATTCHIAGGKYIEYKEDITKVGRITGSSFAALNELWQMRNQVFRSKQANFPPDGQQDQRWINLQPRGPVDN
ncbi:hypothetical protein CKM354_000417100 [Cercospora kikuchii]|uniref:DUF6590 domain-containing protein n=1 Tax=Cercospora kikuchii TaxID=84275 RepID=A0A9P3FB92_9PEZI|nr:uncharacterized protein CKM354_000417100 [Cercospora kikuchii]GIZ40848.1 hypothetical protein CKM354_000417100 [Cercospora kikuchii]